ncbi:unnamed protein product [Linum tenue]|uniref:Uncharacterized protein n=1 Tax=Linum tenue TaxID=586396 RepID=A0AAV0PEZ1_9ROSI|nr:unnamed protein product [Linum tenue]
MSFDEFVALNKFLAKVLHAFSNLERNLFSLFDTAKQGRISLHLNQFIYCTANCRI